MFEVIISMFNKRVFSDGWSDNDSELSIWLRENVGIGSFWYKLQDCDWKYHSNGLGNGCFTFKNINHAVLFKLTWG